MCELLLLEGVAGYFCQGKTSPGISLFFGYLSE